MNITTFDYFNNTPDGTIPITYCVDWCYQQHWVSNYQGVILVGIAFFVLSASMYIRNSKQGGDKMADAFQLFAQLLIIGFFIWLMIK